MAKKRLSVLIIALLAALLAACGDNTSGGSGTSGSSGSSASSQSSEGSSAAPAGEKIKLTYWTFDRHDADFIKEVVDEYNATNTDNIEVVVTSMAENYAQSVDIAFSTNQSPDILRPNQDTTIPFVRKGYLEPLDDYLTDEMKQKFAPTIQDQVNLFDGKIYSLPNFGYTLRLVYNVELFEKAGITEPPSSLAELGGGREEDHGSRQSRRAIRIRAEFQEPEERAGPLRPGNSAAQRLRRLRIRPQDGPIRLRPVRAGD